MDAQPHDEQSKRDLRLVRGEAPPWAWRCPNCKHLNAPEEPDDTTCGRCQAEKPHSERFLSDDLLDNRLNQLLTKLVQNGLEPSKWVQNVHWRPEGALDDPIL